MKLRTCSLLFVLSGFAVAHQSAGCNAAGGGDEAEGGGSASGGKKGGTSGKGGSGGTTAKGGGSSGSSAKGGSGSTGTGGAKGGSDGNLANGGAVGTGGTPAAATPILKLSFDGNAMDSSGNGNNGVVVQGASAAAANHPSPKYSAGKSGMAIELNGVDEWVRIPDSDSIDATGLNNAVSISAWVFINAYTTAKPFNFIAMRQEVGTRLEHFGLSLFNGTPTATVHFFHSSGPQTVPTGEWVHMGFTYNGLTARVYVNGVEAAFNDVGWPIAADETPLALGGGINEEEVIEWINGRIDDLTIYATEITATQMAALAGK